MAKSTSKHTGASKGAFTADATVSERIRTAPATLTSAHQRMTEYVLVNPFRAAIMRTDEFATAADMSIVAANHFTLALGFDGYPQFCTGLLRGFEATLASVEKLCHELARPASSAEIFTVSSNEDIANLDVTRRMLDAVACERAVDVILGAQCTYVMGFGASGYLAGLLCHGLDFYCDMAIAVSQLGGASDTTRQLRKVGPEDLLIAIAFPRYAADTVTLAKQTGKQGCQLLALTDSPISPLAPLADIVLYARPERQLSVTSDTAAVALSEALCGAVAHRSARSLKSVECLTESVLPWLYIVSAPCTNDAPGASGTPTTTRRGRKRAVEN